MEHNPLMNINFPPACENEMHGEMKRLAKPPWAPQAFNPFGKPPNEGKFYFHRDKVGSTPACTLCIHRMTPGHWVVHAITPDEGEPTPLSVPQYKEILSDFELLIAEPAASAVHGVSAIQISKFRLEDYFSQESVQLLQRFCTTSNQSDLGSHPSDQEKWMSFLIRAYDDGNEVHCDIFGDALKNAGLWPEEYISILVREYDFGMRLLKQSGRKGQ